MSSKPLIRLALFDMDGVVFEGRSIWRDLHKSYGTETAGRRLFEEYGGSQYHRLARLVAGRLWKGKPASRYQALVGGRSYQRGIGTVIKALKANHILTGLISSGPYDLAERAQRELGIDRVRANWLEVRDGVLTGRVDVMVTDGNKGIAGEEMAGEFGVTLEETVFVGDSDGDVPLAKRVRLPVAYDADGGRLAEVCHYYLAHGELVKLLDVLDIGFGS